MKPSLMCRFWILIIVLFMNPYLATSIYAGTVQQDLYVANFNFGSPVVNQFDGETGAYKGVFAQGGGDWLLRVGLSLDLTEICL